MNLFELQERLKDFSQDQLVREMQAPTGMAPQFLVLSELQRRQRMMAESQAQMPEDQTTVAEDAIAAAGVPQGGIADMALAMAPRTDMDMNTGVAPVPQMRDGGVVRMQPGGLTGGAFSTGDAELDADLAKLESRGLYSERDAILLSLGLQGGGASLIGDAKLDADLAEIERQRIRLEETLRSFGLQGDGEGLSEVSADVGSFVPAALGGFDISGAAPGPLSRIDADVAAPRSAPGLPPIRLTDAQPILNELAPPAFRDIAPPATIIGPEQGPRLPAEQGPGTVAQRPRLVRQGDDVFVQMGDGSLIPAELLGISDAELQGLDAFDISPVPTQSDLDLDFDRRQRELAQRDADNAGKTPDPTYIVGQGPIDNRPNPIADAYRARLESRPARIAEAARMMAINEIPVYGPSLYDRAMAAKDELLEIFRAGAGVAFPQMDKVPDEIDRLMQENLDQLAKDRAEAGITDASNSFGAFFTSGDEEGAAAFIERARDINRERFGKPPPDKDPPAPSTTPPAGGAPAVDDAFEQDKWLALAQFGLGLMASQQPTFGGAIGEAGLAGITALRQARGERDERIELQQARADRLAAASKERAPKYEDDAVGDLLTQRARLFEEASSYLDSELGTIKPEFKDRYERLMRNIDAIDTMVSAATMARFPGLMEALDGTAD